MKTYKPELKSVIDNFADIYPEPFVVYKRPKAGDLDVRPLTEAMKSQKPAPTIWAVHPKKGSGHRDISGLDAFLRQLCEVDGTLKDDEGEAKIRAVEHWSLRGTGGKGLLIPRINKKSALFKRRETATPADWAAEQPNIVYLQYVAIGSDGVAKQNNTVAVY